MVPLALPRLTTGATASGLGAACFLLLLPACEAADSGDEITRRLPPAAVAGADSIDYARLQVGDSVRGLRVEAIEVHPDAVDGVGWTGSAVFTGRVELTGEPRPHPADPEVTDPCFFVDDSLAARLPRFPNDLRTSWFCFSDPEEASRILPPVRAGTRARIVIDRYHYMYSHTDVYNEARLVAVESLR